MEMEGGAGIGSRKEGTHAVGRTGGILRRDAATPRQLAPEVIMVMFMSPLDAPRRGWDLWRFASLIPSGCRLTPIHKVMGDHASRGPTPAGASLPHGLY